MKFKFKIKTQCSQVKSTQIRLVNTIKNEINEAS